ncbi:MAG: hypothetical protein ACI8S6_005263 [Myxococcota bacterium]|jgi:hypothetical protein
MANPYREVHARLRQRQGGRWVWLLPLIAAAAATPPARPVLLAFLDVGLVPAGVAAITFRVGALVAAAMALHTYSDLIRGPDRPVLDPHPVIAPKLLTAVALRTARQRAYLPAMGAILLSPIAAAGPEGPWVWAGAVAVVFGAWLCALGVGFAVHLGAVWSALSPRLSLLLEMIRGANPRMQAALIYSPGFALAVVGVAVYLASAGLAGAMQGWMPGLGFLALPPAVGVLGMLAAWRLSERYYVRTTTILSEIDAAWAGLEDAEEAGRVYLDWLATGRPELLRALRQGWRTRRLWALGAWGLGAVAVFAGWSEDPSAPAQVLLVAGGGGLLIAAVPTQLAAGDPPWLDTALNVRSGRVFVARLGVAFLYAQGVLLPPAAALLIRQGAWNAGRTLGVLEVAVLCGAALAALAAQRLRGRGLWLYGPAATLLWALILGGFQ